MKISVFRELSFEAAHRNMAAGARPECARLHGHSYRARVWLRGAVDARLGWLRDFAEIKAACAPTLDLLDHRYLNDIDGVADASLTDLTRWFEGRVRGVIPGVVHCEVTTVGDILFRPIIQVVPVQGRLVERGSFWVAAAHLLPMLPEGHKCRRLHGHSFRIEIATAGSVGLLLHLARLHGQLDHQFLNDLPGLANPTSENLARWIWDELAGQAAHPCEVMVQETCTMGCAYRGE